MGSEVGIEPVFVVGLRVGTEPALVVAMVGRQQDSAGLNRLDTSDRLVVLVVCIEPGSVVGFAVGTEPAGSVIVAGSVVGKQLAD